PPPIKVVEQPPPPPPKPKELSLLPKANPDKDAISGKWRMQGGELLSEANGTAVITLPWDPSAEYDLRVDFTPQGSEPDVNVIGQHEGRPFQWYVGAQKSSWYGFGRIDGETAFGHPTGTRQKGLLTPGKRHSTLLEVRKGRLTGYLDGRKLATLDTAGRSLDVVTELLPRDRNRVGLITYFNPSVFHLVEVTPR
ncbi:MAG TPA: hypothetical protein VF950_23460, partial [Planctomycetota bacterium]